MKDYVEGGEYEVLPPSNPDAKLIPLDQLGQQTGINFQFKGLEMKWHPVESMCLTLWARTQGKQEALVEEISKRHFERRQTCADREHLLEAVTAAGLDAAAAEAVLEAGQYAEEVWASYGRMMRQFRIFEIPVFTFSLGPGPFDPRLKPGMQEPLVVIGSADEKIFLQIFERLLERVPEDVVEKQRSLRRQRQVESAQPPAARL
mmetsp:Transcript_160177/g.489868  ORF Transcript_160177/g.489868 Transcript_160177/m.489868 type:complete len:204 (+) Transcript_160177:354-965(+)